MRRALHSLLAHRPMFWSEPHPGRLHTRPTPVRVVVVIVILTAATVCAAVGGPALAGGLAALVHAGVALWMVLRTPAAVAASVRW
ncbi:hypothetical protein ACFYXH_21945 [Streptomyces sp. NPDC002730]|uniref:hypothetical protein n=1 Tax=Streptomyces sp. NPDC002730 TaxID=3364662 RepID=UPI0036788303